VASKNNLVKPEVTWERVLFNWVSQEWL